MQFGVIAASYGAFKNERPELQGWSISGNQLRQFADGVRILPAKEGLKVKATLLTTNVFNTNLSPPRGIALEGAVRAPQAGFITALRVENNQFGCGFTTGLTPPVGLPPQAYVRPSGQAHTGNVGVLIPCQGLESDSSRGTRTQDSLERLGYMTYTP